MIWIHKLFSWQNFLSYTLPKFPNHVVFSALAKFYFKGRFRDQMFHFGLNNVLHLTQSEAHVHTSLPFGHHSKNQLFSKLTLCPLREIALWPFLVRWTTSWRVCKPNNNLTDQVMVYSRMFFQHQHTKGISTLTHSYSSTASSFSRWVPRKSTAHFYYHPNLHLADWPFQQEDDARCQASFHLLWKCADIFCCGT